MYTTPLTLWFITVFEKIEADEHHYPVFGDSRTWGFYTDKDQALRAVKENWTDMHENFYQYAAVEGYDEGICHGRDTNESQWFKWNIQTNGYQEIKRPDELIGFGNLAF